MNLKELRERAGLKQAYVAAKLDVTVPAVCNWEIGKNKISRKYHKKLARISGVTVDELLAAGK